jgi:tRNA(Ile)-lysidine synthase
MLEETVRGTIDRHDMFVSGDSVLVAVSGGADSVVLLHLLRQLSADLDLHLSVAHLDHGWRESSAADARFVASLADEANLRCVCERLDEEEAAIYRDLGREGAAREARRRFLVRAAASVGATRIATGHTADDRAETILYNLTRGAGIAGLSGIDPVSEAFVRPLIDVGRREVHAYAERLGLTWREDETNDDVSFARNRIRHRVLPELQEINPRAVEAICRAGDHAAAATQSEELLVAQLWPDIAVYEEPGEIRLHRGALAGLSAAVRGLVLREAARRVRGDLDGLDQRHILTLVDLVESCAGHADVPLPRLYTRIDGEALSLSSTPYPDAPPWEAPIGLGRFGFPERGFSVEIGVTDRAPAPDASDPTQEVADADRIAFPLSVRNRRAGDRFTPLGMDQPVKLKDFLISERVPYFARDDVPLVCDRGRIVWVAGVRLSEEVRVTGSTTRFLTMRLEVTCS